MTKDVNEKEAKEQDKRKKLERREQGAGKQQGVEMER